VQFFTLIIHNNTRVVTTNLFTVNSWQVVDKQVVRTINLYTTTDILPVYLVLCSRCGPTGVARGGPEGPRPPANEKKNIKASLVNLTLNMSYKMTKKYQICHHQIRFYKLKMHQNPFSAGALPRTPLGELTTLPQTPIVGWGGGYPLPIPLPAKASASRTRRLIPTAPRFSGPPWHKILATPVCGPENVYFISIHQVSLPVDFWYFATEKLITVFF